ncbi:hypothetical protein LNTAR_20138 [Lentisphaera araneosa HTCC2155]|uniref:LamG-like jellyroll fold domain-containing protein n=1 Tax=Lentisphaera araneosa HTCC2155 TaxID=313628 RepID=A6DKV0_9BACT|nr:DUF1553 domain-containing protein [Lentisphaera araneosa]EDM27552.1 hypothetical protein LNTAR_20138 [Lentisphaera araneosa HTCC2155]
MNKLAYTALISATLIGSGCALFNNEDENKLPERVEFNEHIRPILSDKCFHCHGNDPETAEAGLLLNSFEAATKNLSKRREKYAVIPGHPEKSSLVERINTDDEDDIMPPPESHKTLSQYEKDLLAKWIEQGAEFQEHWSFTKIADQTPPEVNKEQWLNNDIDRYVLNKLEDKNLKPNKEATKEKLLRRLSFDTTGLPPSLEELDRFLKDNSADAYEKMVDHYLAQAAYGEHMGRFWLDAARYGDTHGLHLDNYREMWPYRDWVIEAFNKNMPFDQFSTEQLAGDLLPKPSLQQKIASGFNRCNVTTSEGGSIAEEYYVRYAVDRTSTTSTVWLGLTTGCAACHDHKFDPVSQKEFYEMTAFFNNITENAMDGNRKDTPPIIHVMNDQQKKKDLALEAKIAEAKKVVPHNPKDPNFLTWAQKAKTTKPAPAPNAKLALNFTEQTVDIKGKPVFTIDKGKNSLVLDKKAVLETTTKPDFEFNKPFSIGLWVYGEEFSGAIVSNMDNAQYTRGWDIWSTSGRIVLHVINEWPGNALKVETKKAPLKPKKWNHLFITSDGSGRAHGIKIYLNGRTQDFRTNNNNLSKTIKNKKPLYLGGRESQPGFKGKISDLQFFEKKLSPIQVTSAYGEYPIKHLLSPKKDKNAENKRVKELYSYYRSHVDEASLLADKQLRVAENKRNNFLKTIPTTMIMQERPTPRGAYVLDRGQYDQRKDKVEPAVPAFLPDLPKGPGNRLTFAKWLFLPDHPLTSRVTVNRFWQQLFGTGICKTSDDFGSQSEFPSHPQLLDHLAYKFMNEGWDVKKLMKYMLMSASYRQDSFVSDKKLEIDPYNRLISRGPRFRLDAEMIRDNALKSSGLLVEKIGGKSVKPYQPEGIWNAVAYSGSNTRHFKQESGEKLYRRSLYTFLKRTAPAPMMSNFDAPNRETCTVRRERTNTPLQALQLMNDVQYLEASRHLATKALQTQGDNNDKIKKAFRKVTSRFPNKEELIIMSEVLQAHHKHFEVNANEAKELIAHGESKVPKDIDSNELAAWTMLCSQLYNLDEAITKE